jgi:hypothetical protein
MDFSTLVDQIEDLVADGSHGLRSSGVRVDKKKLDALVFQLRGAVPEELRDARWIAEEREEMLEEAKRAAVRMLEEAREERARLLAKEEIAEGAERRAEKVLADAERLDHDIRGAAEDYAHVVLESLEAYLAKFAGSAA